ncbi:MAG: glycoside hydrolase family 2 TIM barrel-domain containing protein [Rikenellaceae bacterium]
MKLFKLLSTLIACCATMLSATAQYTPDENFDKGWQFHKGAAEGAEKTSFDDSKWRTLNLPHDWAIEGPFSVKNDCRMGALPISGTGWYRKSFKMKPEDKDKIVRIEFEGAMSHATVWVNGEQVGYRPYGYIGYEYDITKQVKFDGSENVVAVRLQPLDLSSRWYPGAGLHRSVWLKVDEPIHVDLYGAYITTPTVQTDKAVIQNMTTIVNKTSKDQEVELTHNYFDNKGQKVATSKDKITVKANSKEESGTYTNVKDPALWGIYKPNLYTVETQVTCNGKVMDSYKTRFGIRRINYNAEAFYINDEQVRFNGVNIHHDNGALGAAVYKSADRRKLQIMKDMGVNAIRASHNPPSREFLELCDEMGIVIIDELYDAWEIAKVKNGYNTMYKEWHAKDLESTLLRDRNHPSVIMWSVGNEILEQHKDWGWKMARELHKMCKAIDPTRPTTIGFNSYPTAYIRNMAQQVDIAGMNYKGGKYAEQRKNFPQVPIYGSETAGMSNTRGFYLLPITKDQFGQYKDPSLKVTSYPITGPIWTYPADLEFYFQRENPSVMGEFIWTGIDYLGETSPFGGEDNVTGDGHWNGDYPVRSSSFGAVDLAGFPKDRFFAYQAQWTKEPMVHLMPHWNWKGMEGFPVPVQCMTNCEEAELFFNGESLGRKVKGKDLTRLMLKTLRYEPDHFDSPYRLEWIVPYKAGELKVVAYTDGKVMAEQVIRTAGKPAKITLSCDRSEISADGKDLSYVTVRIEDKDGNFCPLADNRVSFSIEGEGVILATDNGDAASIEPFQQNHRKAFHGLALAIVRSNDKASDITIKATSKGLKAAQTTIKATK